MTDGVEFLQWLVGTLIATTVGGFATTFLILNYKYKRIIDAKSDARHKDTEDVNKADDVRDNMKEYVKNEVEKVQTNLDHEMELFHNKLDNIKDTIGYVKESIDKLNHK